MKTLRALAFALALLPSAALGQSAPATMGYHTVYGRIGGVVGDTGPGQAIPWATLLANIAGTQSANTVWAGPTSGGVAAPAFRSLVGADLPVPGASSLGGIQSISSLAHNWIAFIDTAGVPHQSQPAFSDLAGTTTTVSPGSYANANITVGADGRLTAASNGAVGSGINGLFDVTLNGLVHDLQGFSDGVSNSTTTFTSATANFQPGDVGKTIAIIGAGAAGGTAVTTIASRTNSTTIVLTAATSTSASGLTFHYGTDNTSALNTLITSLGAGCGQIWFPKGSYLFAGKINITLSSCNFQGQGPFSSASLFYVNTGSANFIDVQSVQFTKFSDLTLRATSPNWTGFIATVRDNGSGNPAFTSFSRMTISPSTLSSGMILDTAIETEVLNSSFSGGVVGITGRQTGGSFSNIFRMKGGQFLNQSSAAVTLGGNAWSFDGVTFENRPDGKLVAFNGDTTVPTSNLSFTNCWLGDATVAGATTFTVWGQGFTFVGNLVAGGGAGDTAISLNNVKGFNINGNVFKFYTNVVNYATTTVQGGLLSGNAFATGITLEANTGNKDATVINTGNIAF